VDYAPFGAVEPPGRFDAVTVMAVLEHYPHSPKRAMANVVAMTRERGYVYIEVPNIAYWPKRVGLLRGRTPLPPISEVFLSEVPYLGHHHEYTTAELKDLVTLSGLRVHRIYHSSYSQQGTRWQRFTRKPLETLALAVLPEAREIVSVLCRRGD
jgi:2-polyprenyl-3-methyl-5-hydroxy-6-metoxy-1,4-benzoquinol methylase